MTAGISAANRTLLARTLVEDARIAMSVIAEYDQERTDRLVRAIGWATGNDQTVSRLAIMSVGETDMGDAAPSRRFKILGALRDSLRQRSMGIIEEIPSKGIVKYGKPAGVIAALIPLTNPYVTAAVIAIYAVKCKNAVIMSPHSASRKTTNETVRVIREALKRQGAPEALAQCIEYPSIPLASELMSLCDLTIAAGSPSMVKLAATSGKPMFGGGVGNATVIVDETANIDDAVRGIRISKMNDNGSGCSADGNVLVDATIYGDFITGLQREGGYVLNEKEKRLLEAVLWDDEGRRTIDTIARPAVRLAQLAGFHIPAAAKFLVVCDEDVREGNLFATPKIGTVLSVFKYHGFDMALELIRRIYDISGKGHSCGIYSFDNDHIHRLALEAPVSRMMVRQPLSKSNGGSFENGMPMTSTLGCGFWGGNITNENISLNHYMNITWVSHPISEDRPSEEELFGEFYNSEVF